MTLIRPTSTIALAALALFGVLPLVIIPLIMIVAAITALNAKDGFRPAWLQATGLSMGLAFLGPLGLTVAAVIAATWGGWGFIL